MFLLEGEKNERLTLLIAIVICSLSYYLFVHDFDRFDLLLSIDIWSCIWSEGGMYQYVLNSCLFFLCVPAHHFYKIVPNHQLSSPIWKANPAVTWLKYSRYGLKHKAINQSINQSKSESKTSIQPQCVLYYYT